jgi:hypothetical protein
VAAPFAERVLKEQRVVAEQLLYLTSGQRPARDRRCGARAGLARRCLEFVLLPQAGGKLKFDGGRARAVFEAAQSQQGLRERADLALKPEVPVGV